MPLCRYTVAGRDEPRLGVIDGDQVIDAGNAGGPDSLTALLQLPAAEALAALRRVAGSGGASTALSEVTLHAPIDAQEVWAAGVTYLRSRDARMEESTQRDVYDRVYDAARPEIFLKATPNRVSGPGEPIAIRGDSEWDVPEPELTLLLNTGGEMIGYTIGNDVSSRSIEGDNPLYLPQAKVYARCAAIGPVIVTTAELADAGNLTIRLTIRRGGDVLFTDSTSTSRIHRTLDDLATYLVRCNDYPAGVYLMTGTGIVPPSEFTLQAGDEVSIEIEKIGTLTNPVIRLAV
ncbi:MAG: fumarylacetoacetate hydrolase family protein [Thermomicrobiales bacterium]